MVNFIVQKIALYTTLEVGCLILASVKLSKEELSNLTLKVVKSTKGKDDFV
jgi:hypothetical protein